MTIDATNTTTGITTGLRLTTKHHWLKLEMHLCRPRVEIDDGDPLRVGWGETFLPLAPGRHTVSVSYRYCFRRAGQAMTTVVVDESGETALHYKAPFFNEMGPGRFV